MPRNPRYDVPDALHHVTNRGLERRNIIRDDLDRNNWWRLLDRVATRCRWRVFATVLLDNHFYIFLRTPEANLSVGMHDVESGYATLFNGRHERSGPLFQGRFHAVAVENESHCWELSRYVHLNPYRARLANDPMQYRWSTYRHYLNPRSAPQWLDWHTVLAEFGGTEAASRLAYKRFVESGLKTQCKNPMENLVDGWILGSAQFVDCCRARIKVPQEQLRPTLDAILDAVGLRFETDRQSLTRRGRHGNRAREAAMLLARELTLERLGDLGQVFGGISPSGVSELVRRAEFRGEREPEFAQLLQELKRQLV